MAGFLLPLLLGAGSIAANSFGANQAQDAMQQVSDLYGDRKRRNDRRAFEINAKARNRFDDFSGQQDAKTSDLAGLYTSAVDSAPQEPLPAMPSSDSGIVTSRIASENAAAKEDANQNAEARARLESFGDLFGDKSIGMARDAGKLGQIGSFQRGWDSILPLELQAAQQKGAGWMMLGDLLNLGSGLTLPGALRAGAGGLTMRGDLFGPGGVV